MTDSTCWNRRLTYHFFILFCLKVPTLWTRGIVSTSCVYGDITVFEKNMGRKSSVMIYKLPNNFISLDFGMQLRI